MVLSPTSTDTLKKEVALLRLELGPYANLESMLKGKTLLEQRNVLLLLHKVERRSAALERRITASTIH